MSEVRPIPPLYEALDECHAALLAYGLACSEDDAQAKDDAERRHWAALATHELSVLDVAASPWREALAYVFSAFDDKDMPCFDDQGEVEREAVEEFMIALNAARELLYGRR